MSHSASPSASSIPNGSKVLVICEKPSVARDMAKVLGAEGGSGSGEGYITLSGGRGWISWARGHLVELSEPKDYREDWQRWDWSLLPMIPEGFNFTSSPKKDARGQLGVIKELYGKADVLVNACDAGREGELIWWEVVRYVGWGKGKAPGVPGAKPALRFWAQSNTPDGISEAWGSMRPVSDMLGLALSAYSRNEGDWLLGLNMTRAATLAFPPQELKGGKRGIWSLGRVQTPVLALIVGRDEEIEAFKPSPFYEVRIQFEGDTDPFEATLLVPPGVPAFISDVEKSKGGNGEDKDKDKDKDKGSGAVEVKAFLTRADAAKAVDRVLSTMPDPWLVKQEAKVSSENPPLLFSLTDLQKWANQQWGWEAKRTLDAAQAAYETDKTLSYPRTDACHLPKDAISKMDQVFHSIRGRYLDAAVPTALPPWVMEPSSSTRASVLFDDSKLTDHYAIVPTGVIPSDFSSDSGRIWLAVVRRFFVSFSPAAKVETIRRRLSLEEDTAVCSGKRYLDRGWLELDGLLAPLTGGTPKSDPETLPGCASSTPALDVRLHEGKTTPPKHFTEATLLAVMENIHTRIESDEEELKEALSGKGIGTPATRAAIIELLIARSYIVRSKKGTSVSVKATDSGRELIGNLRGANLEFLTRPDLTAGWESSLNAMERDRSVKAGGEDARVTFLKEIEEKIRESLDLLGKAHTIRPSAGGGGGVSSPTGEFCPKSGDPVLDCGAFWQFPGYPGARFYKEVAKKTLTLQEMVAIVDGKDPLPVLDGFVSKKGSKFSAALRFDPVEKKLSFEFPKPVAAETTHTCPLSGELVQDHGSHWTFPGAKGAKYWKVLLKRSMKLEEYSSMLEHGKSEVLDGFVSSKTGNKFSAMITPSADGVKFEFPPREGGPVKGPISPKMTGPGAKGRSSSGSFSGSSSRSSSGVKPKGKKSW